MSDRRTRFKDHVRAAREWLGQAEASLEQEDHIRGDLDVMLAQAELRRAREVESGAALRGWRRPLLPLAAALALAAWAGSSALAPPAPVAPAAPAPAASLPVGEMAPVGAPPVDLAAPPAEPAPPLIMAEAEGNMAQEEAAELPPAESPPAGEQAARLPSARLQKLMSSAGQSLRAP